MDTSKSGSDTNIQVFIRIRPPCNEEPSYSRVLEVNSAETQLVLKHGDTPRTFSFDHVADVDARQETIFNILGKKVIDNCIAGYNGTIFAYGQTGSGKTFTMMGPSEDTDNFGDELRGVIPRSFEYLFSLIKREKELHGDSKQFLCKCSFLEIYNEQIFDLLEPSPQVLHLRESLKMGVYVAGLAEQIVVDASEAYQLLSSSWMNRRVASTSMNRESSRSHAVFTLIIESKEMKGGSEHIKTSQLNLVDLAGSESQKNTNATGMRLKEAGSINKSLSNLGNVIMCLVCISKDGNERRHVPYRDSKLTFLLRSSLGGNSKTSLIACVHSGHKYYAETISTLQFAKRAKMIKNKAVLNENAQVNIQHLQMEVKRLREELSQYKSGAIMPVEPSEGQTPQPAPEPTPELKVMFLRAMNFYQQAQMEKMEIENELKESKRIADKIIRQKVMIIKFREDAIKRHLEKAKGSDCEDETVQSLQEEIKALREENAHHPLVTKYSRELQKLRIEIKNMKSSQEWLEKVEQRDQIGEALEKRYKELVTDQKVVDNEPLTTPSRTDSISTATVDKLRSEKRDLVEEVKMLKQSLNDATEDFEEKLKNLTHKLEYSTTTIQNLEAIIGANETRNKIEMAQITERHLQTINTITTPTKKEEGGRQNPESPLHSTFFEQIKDQQGLISNLEVQLDESKRQNLLKENSIKMLERRLGQMEELVEKEKMKEGSARQALTELESKMALDKEQMDRDLEEINDLRMVLKSADKELKDVKQKYKSVEALRLTDKESFDTQLEKLERSLEQLKKDMDTELEIKEELKNELDIQKDNATFHVNLTLQLEEKLKEKEKEIEDVHSKLKLSEEQLCEERLHHENKSNQLSSEGMMKEQLYLAQCSENAKLKTEISDLKAEVKKHSEAEERATRLYNQAMESINKQFCRIQEEADKIADLQQTISGLTEQLDSAKLADEEYQSQIIKLQNDAESTTIQNMFDKRKLQVKIDSLEEDLASLQDATSIYEKEVDSLRDKNTILEKAASLLRQEHEDFKHMKETSKLDLSMQEIEFEDASSKIKDLTNVIKKNEEEMNALKSTLDELAKDKSKALSQANELSFKNQELQERLKKQTDVVEHLRKRVEQSESNTQSLRLDYDQKKKELTEALHQLERLQNVVFEKEDLVKHVTRLTELARKDNEEKRNLEEQLEHEKNELKKIHGLFEDEQDPNFTDIQYIHNRIQVLKAEHQKLLAENSILIGHSNHKQKIKYHEQVKNENLQLKKELTILEGKNRHLQDQLLKREKSKPDPLCPMKENTEPVHKLFFSGDYTSNRK